MNIRLICVLLFSTLFSLTPVFADKTIITGAGSTLAYPLYAKWAQVYEGISGVKIQYNPVGSRNGVNQLEANTVDFGASDKPLADDELKKAGLIQFPMAIGSVVPIVNLPKIPQGLLKLSGPVLADIYLGKITKWNDPAIAALNSDLTLPNLLIKTVHREAGSGTTFIFTNYLAKVSADWKNKLAHEATLTWPVGATAIGSENVALNVLQNPGAIGYVEYSFAQQLNYVSLKNNSGKFVLPSSETFKATADNADWKTMMSLNGGLTDVAGDNSWPINGVTFIIIHTSQNDKNHALETLKFFDWCYKLGQNIASQLGYSPIADKFITPIENTWTKQIKDKNNNVVWKK